MMLFSMFYQIIFVLRQLPRAFDVMTRNHSLTLLPNHVADENIFRKVGGIVGGNDGNDDDGSDTPGYGWWPSIKLDQEELFMMKMKQLIDYVPPEKLLFSHKQWQRNQEARLSVSFIFT